MCKSVGCLIGHHMIVTEPHFLPLLLLFFEHDWRCLEPYLWKTTWLYYFSWSSKFFFHFVPLQHTLCSWKNKCIVLAVLIRLCILSSWYHLYVYYVYKRLNVLVCTNVFILSFLLLCTMLVYHGYSHANFGPLRVGTRLNSIPTAEHFSNPNVKQQSTFF